MSKKKLDKTEKPLFHPVTRKLGEEGRKGAAEAARRILEKIEEMKINKENRGDL